MKRTKKNIFTVIAASSVTFFSLASCVIAVIAWFSFAQQAHATGETFRVEAANDSGCEIGDINLYKFNYSTLTVGQEVILNYADPALGNVGKYLYDEGFTKHYIYDNENSEWTTETINPGVSVMNTFDPVYLTINRSQSLLSMNCNAIYEIELTSESHNTCYLQLDALRKTDIEENLTSSQILLTSCIDFDVYLESDFADGNFPNNEYRPSYYGSLDRELNDIEKVYYKISYLSHQKEVTAANANPTYDPFEHFYSGSDLLDNVPICANRQVTFTNSKLKVYVNVNYNLKQLQKYSDRIYSGDITAVLDYYLSFDFSSTISVASISLNQTNLSLEVNDTSTLTATVLPNNAADRTVTWSTSDASVATVNNGTVTAVSSGTAIISAKAGKREVKCLVTVTEPEGQGE